MEEGWSTHIGRPWFAAGITPQGLDAPRSHRVPIIPVTILASASINASDAIVVELVEADETPAVVIVRWPDKASVLHPRRFPGTAAVIVRLFSEAHITLAQVRARRRL